MTDERIRLFQDRDYPAIVTVGNAIYTDYPWSEDEARHDDARYDGIKYSLRRFVVELPDGRIAGHCDYHHIPHMFHPQKFWIDVLVHPEFQGRGLGSRLYDHLMEALAPHHPLTLWTFVRETFPRSVAFAMRRGFREVRRSWESRLDVASFDRRPFEERTREAVAGMQIVTVADEREREPQWLEKLYDMHNEAAADAPQPQAYTPQTMDEYYHRLFDNPDYLPDAHFLMKDAGRYVAESFLFRSHELPDVLYQGFTGTRRAYRGKGIALALKLRVVDYARLRAHREIRTWNDTLNAPMLAINTKLGFLRQPAWIMFEKATG